MPDSTIILTTFRRPDLLRRAIRSILGQTQTDFRLSIYDNGSGDSTGDMVREFQRTDPRIELFQRPENIAPYDNVSDAIARLETPFFTICGDDDFLFPCHLATLEPVLAADPDLAYAFGSFLYVSLEGEISNLCPGDWPGGRAEAGTAALNTIRHGHVAWQAALFRTDLVRRAGGGPTKSVGLIGDVDFLLKLGSLYPVHACAEIVAVHSCHPGQGGASYGLGESSGLATMYRRLAALPCVDRAERRLFLEILRHWLVQFLCSLTLSSPQPPAASSLTRAAWHLLTGLRSGGACVRFLDAALRSFFASPAALDPIRRQAEIEAGWLAGRGVGHVRPPEAASAAVGETRRLAEPWDRGLRNL